MNRCTCCGETLLPEAVAQGFDCCWNCEAVGCSPELDSIQCRPDGEIADGGSYHDDLDRRARQWERYDREWQDYVDANRGGAPVSFAREWWER